MVEDITKNALDEHVAFLCSQGALEDVLGAELERLKADSSKLSNWTEAGHFLQSGKYERLRGEGPISKVLRTLAYLLEQIRHSAPALLERGVRVTRIRLENTRSGCSDYTGEIRAECQTDGGIGIILCDGSFVWDCAAHGLPQTQAAQQLGYRCMVSFPEIWG